MYRFAPSPTGDMHIGNLRVAIFNYIASLQDKSGFILRIEDTDKERNIEGKDKEIMEILKKFGIKWDTLYYQSQNLKFHQEFGAKLLIDKKAFLCFFIFLHTLIFAPILLCEVFIYDSSCSNHFFK